MMDPLRTAGIWLGVGAGHVALLVAAWGVSGPAEPSDGGLLTLVLVAPEAAPAAPAPAPTRAERVEVGPSARRVVVAAPAEARLALPVPAVQVVRPGPVASEPVGEPPSFVDRIEPAYPRGARLAGVEGVVRLRLRVGSDGTLRRVDVVGGSGDAALDRAAVSAASASTYRAARVGGRPVEAEVESTYRFELR